MIYLKNPKNNIIMAFRSRKRYLGLYFLTFAVSVIFLFPSLISDGMFMDGQQYACVSKNMAEGSGSFWFPMFTEIGVGGYHTFHEQPPLMFGMQALSFKILGPGFLSERIYGLVMWLITLFCLISIYQVFVRKKLLPYGMGWLPILLWMIVPLVSWVYANNLVELTMGVFTSLSFLFFIKAYWTDKNMYLWFTLAGISIFLASFTKGLPGIFTLSVPLAYYLAFRTQSLKKTIIQSFYLLAIIAACYGVLLFLFPEARESLYIHWVERAFSRIGNDPVVDHHYQVIISLLTELLPIYLPVVLIITWRFFSGKERKLKKMPKLSVFFLIIALSGSLPLMLTLVQRNFYYACAIPFFAFAAAAYLAPILEKWLKPLQQSKPIFFGGIFLLLASIIFSATFYKKPMRDVEILEDVYTIGNLVGENQKILSNGDVIFNDWAFRSYLLRYYNIELVNYLPGKYYVFGKDRIIDYSYYDAVDCQLNEYKLFVRKSVAPITNSGDE